MRPRDSASHGNFDFLKCYVQQHADHINSLVRQSGAVLFRGFNIDCAQQFEDIALLLKPVLSTKYLGTSPRTPTSTFTFTASEIGPNKPLPAHTEMAFLPKSKPERIFFCCLQPSSYGGETPLVRVDHILRDLDVDVCRKFEQYGVTYVRNYA
ncbi:unnamed protein product, partial [Didymodactylos carnosus]